MKNLLFLIPLLFYQLTIAQKMDDKSTLHLFKRMELVGIDLNQNLLYGYFFIDKNNKELDKLGKELKKQSYRFVKLEKEDDSDYYILHIEKIEVHSGTSMLKRKEELQTLAKKFKVELFDGWDVGSAKPNEALTSNEDFKKFGDSKSDLDLFKWANDLYDFEMCDEAIKAFSFCYERNINKDTSLYKQACCFSLIENSPKAIELFEKALELNPRYEKAAFNIGVECYQQNQFEKSVLFYKKTIEINPQNDKAYYGVAASLYTLQKLVESKKYCKKALEINPKNELAKELLELYKN